MRFQKFCATWLGLFLLSLVIVGGVASAEEKCLREEWSVAEQDQKPVGFALDQLWRTNDGYRYICDATVQIAFLGSQATTMTQHMEMTVDQNYLAKAYLGVFDINGSRTQIKAAFSPNQVTMTTLTADGKETVTTQKVAQPLYFAYSYLDCFLKNGKLKTGATAKAAVWDIGNLIPGEYSLTVNEKTSYTYNGKKLTVFNITEKEGQESQSLIDKNGNHYSGNVPKLKLSYRRVEKDQIPELKAMNLDVLLVPGNRSIAFPFRSIASKIKVKWASVAFNEFDFADNRQKLTSHSSESGKQVALLEINREQRDFPGKVVLPVKDPAFAASLADVEYITPSSPAVQKLSQQILNGETDGWRATQKLTQWVFQYIKPALIPETLTAEQIIAGKTGKCVEYAVLFASLARSAGLPTRVVMGERYQDNMWIGHLWNEVWLGEWITVDASHNQVAPDALLLKFIASDTVLGTQKVRNGLIGELEIEILDVKLDSDAPEAKSDVKTGIVGQMYTNADYKCRMKVPDGWKLAERQEQGIPELLAQKSDNPITAYVLIMFSVPQGTQADLVLESRIPQLKTILPEFTLLKEEKQTLNQLSAAVGTWEFTYSGTKLMQQNWIVIRGDVGYLLVFQAPSADWQKVEPEFQAMRDQFTMFE